MKRAFVVLTFLALVSCASTPADEGPAVEVRLAPLGGGSDMFYFPGPVALQYQVAVSNPLPEPIVLKRLDLDTMGTGAYVLHTRGTPMNVKIPPSSNGSFAINVWGRALGGHLNAGEPVTLRGVAYFDGPKGAFVKLLHENIQAP
jgi:hypothetical protein